MSLTLTAPVTKPDDEPVSLAEARQHMRIPDGDTTQDTLIVALIQAARKHAEVVTRRALVTQDWTLTGDHFPGLCNPYRDGRWITGGWISLAQAPIKIPLPPLVSVASVKYYDDAGVQQTMDPSLYKVDIASEPGRIYPVYGQDWPSTRTQLDAVEIKFTAGYGEPSAVPEGIKRWMLVRIGSMYESREEDVIDTRLVQIQPSFVDSLLADYTLYSF